jgi:enoyl-CoA hydratase
MIISERRGSVAVLRMEHKRANALDVELCGALRSAFREVGQSDARAVVLTGTGHIFSAGADLFRVLDGGDDYIGAFLPALSSALMEMFTFPRPVVAAINGHAIAGGCILACACDYRLMADGRGTIGVPELVVGVPFPITALEILRFAVPGQHLQRLAYVGQTLLPQASLEAGLVDDVIDAHRLLDRACELADQIGAIPSRSFRTAKRWLRQAAIDRIERHAQDADPEVTGVWRQPETYAAVRAYLDRTLPAKKASLSTLPEKPQ